MKTLFLLFFTISCISAPVKNSQNIIQERNEILSQAMPQFRECVELKNGEMDIQLKFTLYNTQSPFLVRPHKVAYDPQTNKDNIVIRLVDKSSDAKVAMDCLRRELRKLDFKTVNPAYEYMQTHEYVMTFRGEGYESVTMSSGRTNFKISKGI